jgi:hypothetical protein
VHGTTKQPPLLRFRKVEQAALRPLPGIPYEPSSWKQVKLHRDCYVVFEQAFYSAPYALVGQRLWLRAGARTVELYNAAYQRVAIHDRAIVPGQRLTRFETAADHAGAWPAASRPVVRRKPPPLVRPLGGGRSTPGASSEDRLSTAGVLLRLAERFTPSGSKPPALASTATRLRDGQRILERANNSRWRGLGRHRPSPGLCLSGGEFAVGRGA